MSLYAGMMSDTAAQRANRPDLAGRLVVFVKHENHDAGPMAVMVHHRHERVSGEFPLNSQGITESFNLSITGDALFSPFLSWFHYQPEIRNVPVRKTAPAATAEPTPAAPPRLPVPKRITVPVPRIITLGASAGLVMERNVNVVKFSSRQTSLFQAGLLTIYGKKLDYLSGGPDDEGGNIISWDIYDERLARASKADYVYKASHVFPAGTVPTAGDQIEEDWGTIVIGASDGELYFMTREGRYRSRRWLDSAVRDLKLIGPICFAATETGVNGNTENLYYTREPYPIAKPTIAQFSTGNGCSLMLSDGTDIYMMSPAGSYYRFARVVVGGEAGEITALAESRDELCLAAGYADGTVKLWRGGVPVKRWQAHDGRIASLVFSPNGRLLATASAPADADPAMDASDPWAVLLMAPQAQTNDLRLWGTDPPRLALGRTAIVAPTAGVRLPLVEETPLRIVRGFLSPIKSMTADALGQRLAVNTSPEDPQRGHWMVEPPSVLDFGGDNFGMKEE